MSDYNITFKANDGVAQLVAVSVALIDESVNHIVGLDLPSLTLNELNNLGRTVLAQIDNSYKYIDAVAGIPNAHIIESRLLLQRNVDKLYCTLTNTYNQYQDTLIVEAGSPSNHIQYAKFCHDLSLKLLQRASVEAVEQQALEEANSVTLIYE